MENYETIFKNHEGFISDKWVHYFYIYDKLFRKYRKNNKPLTIMEIGVAKGGSLEIWKKYLPESSVIHGVDINSKCNEIKFSENIYFHHGSASDKIFMEKTFLDVQFDIILDDGSHKCSDVIKTFEIMFPKIKDGGLYIVEDLCSSYWQTYEGGYKRKNSSIEYFKNLIDILNNDYIFKLNNFRKFSKYFDRKFIDRMKILLKKDISFKGQKEFDYKKHIESVIFFDCICAIKKYSSIKNKPFKAILTGRDNIGERTSVSSEIETLENTRRIYGV